MANLEDVFLLSGTPTYTFVPPSRYNEIKLSVRTPGRCSIIEGPSGIGKTSAIDNIIGELGLAAKAMILSGREKGDIEFIASLPEMGDIGIVVVDDFHRLPVEIKANLADYMKLLADRRNPASKLILIGINEAGRQLITFAADLGLRLDIFRVGANSSNAIMQLIEKGEQALNVRITGREEVARIAQGSFQLAQLLCYQLCILDGVEETQADFKDVNTSVNVAIEDVMESLGRTFKKPATIFAQGAKLRQEGRAPYLHMLNWLSLTDDGVLDLVEAARQHQEMRGSIIQVIEKGWLSQLLRDNASILQPYFHFEESTRILSVEDPKVMFWLKNIIWRVFTKQVGYRLNYFSGKYDFALSFAGADRNLAAKIHVLLQEREVECFYDLNEQHRIIAANVEDYLAPIYRSEAKYVVALLSPSYPARIWTKFESDNFKERFGTNSIVPIRFGNLAPGFFYEEDKYGGLSYDPLGDLAAQAEAIVDTLCKRLVEDRLTA